MTTTARKALAEEMAKDLAARNARKYFDVLKAMEEDGKGDTAEFADLLAKYRTAFKTAHGYNSHCFTSHWVR